MSSAFSSNDTEVLQRDISINADKLEPTPYDELKDVYEIEHSVKYINENNFETVALQFPDELLVDAANVTRILQSQLSAKIYLLADTSYGSYDIDEIAAQHIKADLIIHYGKTALTTSSATKTLFVFGRKHLDCDEVCNAFLATYTNNNSKVLLLVQPQWYHAKDSLSARLKPAYPNLIVANIRMPNQPKQVGNDGDDSCRKACRDCSCRTNRKPKEDEMDTDQFSNDEPCCGVGFYQLEIPVENTFGSYSIFFIGTENSESLRNTLLHHPNSTGFVFDPMTSCCKQISLPVSKLLMKRFYVIEKIKDAKSVGILVGTLGMAGYKAIINHLKKILSASGKKTYTFVVGKLNSNKLANFPEIDIFVLVACPEESIVDSKEYFKPICTPYEAELACNANREWSDIYPLDFRQLLPGGEFYVEFKPRSDDNDVSLITGNVRHHDDVHSDATTDVEVRHVDSRLNVFHPHAAAHHFSQRSWQGLEQKLGETPVEEAKEGRSGVPVSYTYGS